MQMLRVAGEEEGHEMKLFGEELLVDVKGGLEAVQLQCTARDEQGRVASARYTLPPSSSSLYSLQLPLLYGLVPQVYGDRFSPSLEEPTLLELSMPSHPSVAPVSFKRCFLRPGFRRIPLDSVIGPHHLYGTLFLPPEGSFSPGPAIVEIGGSAGGLIEWRSAYLASAIRRPVLALAWFRYEELPVTMDVDLAYVKTAIEWLLSQPSIPRLPVSLYAISKGTEVAFAVALEWPHLIESIVSVGGSATLSEPRFLLHGEPYEKVGFVPLDIGKAIWHDTHVNMFPCFDYHSDPSTPWIPVDRLDPRIRVLFLCGEDDQNLPAEKNAKKLRSMMKNPGELLVFAGTGHLIEPPSPHCSVCHNRLLGKPLEFGGSNVEAHAKGREEAFKALVRFLTIKSAKL